MLVFGAGDAGEQIVRALRADAETLSRIYAEVSAGLYSTAPGRADLTGPLLMLAAAALLLVGLPLVYALFTFRFRLRPIFKAVVSLPLVLPPTVLGFYLLLMLAPDSALGRLWQALTGG